MSTGRGFRARWVIAAILLGLSGCGDDPADESAASTSSSTTIERPESEGRENSGGHGPDELEPPPPVTIHYFDESRELEAWTYCYKNGCADGMPPKNPFDVGSPDEIRVEFPLGGWTFNATFTPAGERCGRNHVVKLEETGDGTFLLEPAGHAGTYDVTLFGRGDGDLFTSFRWTTPVDGPLPEPSARTAVIANHDGVPDSYGIELELANLASTPKRASATITVRAANGKSLTFDAAQAKGSCWPEGTVYWDGPDDEGLAAAKLGDPPFTYKVRVRLDGKDYVATATWPDDEIRGNAPSVRLDFRPALPALQ